MGFIHSIVFISFPFRNCFRLSSFMQFSPLVHDASAALLVVVRGVFSRPFSGRRVVLGSIELVLQAGAESQGAIWIRVAQETADGQENLGNAQSWGPAFHA